jgi:hypothetical protein
MTDQNDARRLEEASRRYWEHFDAETARLGATDYGQAFTAADIHYTTTGGGCTAWGAELPHEGMLLITSGYADGDCSMDAEADENTTEWQVGESYYGEGAPAEAEWEYRTFPIADHAAAAAYAAELLAKRRA